MQKANILSALSYLVQNLKQKYIASITASNGILTITKGDNTTDNVIIDNVQKAEQDNLGQKITDYVKDVTLDEDNTLTVSKGDTKTVSKIEVSKIVLETKDIINVVYPVGSIISTLDETNPGDRWKGTTWEQIEAGRVLVSAGTAETGTVFTARETGGEETHQLTVGELPTVNIFKLYKDNR